MWGKVVTYMGPASNWAPRYALLQRGDGPICAVHGGNTPQLFHALAEAVEWAREEGWEYLVTDELITYTRMVNGS